jgi:hypothetical protein
MGGTRDRLHRVLRLLRWGAGREQVATAVNSVVGCTGEDPAPHEILLALL